jgi:hypothetical protein
VEEYRLCMCIFGRAIRGVRGRVLATAHRTPRFSRGRQDVSALRDSVDEDTRKDAMIHVFVSEMGAEWGEEKRRAVD